MLLAHVIAVLLRSGSLEQEDEHRIGVLADDLAFAGDGHGPLHALVAAPNSFVLQALDHLLLGLDELLLVRGVFEPAVMRAAVNAGNFCSHDAAGLGIRRKKCGTL